MKVFTKTAILILSILAFALIMSCGADQSDESRDISPMAADDGGEKNETNTEESAAEKLLPDLPEVSYGGDAFTFLVREYDSNGYWGSYEIYAAEETGDSINDAVYQRNRAVEDRLDIDIREVRGDVVGLAQKSIKAGDAEYDCLMPSLVSAGSMASSGYLLSFDRLPYIDLEKPWWDINTKNMTIGGRLFFTVGDLCIMDKDSIFIVMFNKTVAKNSGTEDLYSLVRENKWTLDKFHSIIKETARDLNGDGKLGFDDLAGLVSSDFGINIFYYNSGETVTKKDENDYPYFTPPDERSVLAAEKAYEIICDKSAAVLASDLLASGISNPWTDGINRMFQDDRALFFVAQVTFIHRTRTMESDFGILPSPKLDEAQGAYYTSINPGVSNCIAVPTTVADAEKTSVILEALSAESKYTLMPAYYDITITNKMIRDEDSSEMLDLILSSRIFDLGYIFNWGDLGNVPLSLFPNGGSFVSTYEKREQKAKTEMEKTLEAFRSLDN